MSDQVCKTAVEGLKKRGYGGRAWDFRLFCATYAAARFGRSYAVVAHRKRSFT